MGKGLVTQYVVLLDCDLKMKKSGTTALKIVFDMQSLLLVTSVRDYCSSIPISSLDGTLQPIHLKCNKINVVERKIAET